MIMQKIVLQKMKLRLHQKIVNTENSSSVFLMNNKKIRLIFIKNVNQTYVWVFLCNFHDVLWHCIISHYNIFYTCFHQVICLGLYFYIKGKIYSVNIFYGNQPKNMCIKIKIDELSPATTIILMNSEYNIFWWTFFL